MIKFKKRATIEDRFQNMDAEAGFTFDEFGRLKNVRRPLKEAMEVAESKSDADKLFAFLGMDEDLAEGKACKEDCNEEVEETDESLTEDTVKQGGKWVNKGKEGTHGKFDTKKEADDQRKAMFSNGYKG